MADLDALRDLHAPTERLTCEGCDFEGWEAQAPDWPCRTAEVVYEQDEIDYITSSYRWWSKWGRERARRARLAQGWEEPTLLQRIYGRQLKDMLTATSFFTRLAETPAKGGVVSIPIVGKLDG